MYIWLSRLPKRKSFDIIFELRAEENLVVNVKCLSRNSRSAPREFDVVKTSVIALEASLLTANSCFKNIKFLRGNYQPIVVPVDDSSTFL